MQMLKANMSDKVLDPFLIDLLLWKGSVTGLKIDFSAENSKKDLPTSPHIKWQYHEHRI
jgi:hypothetical protein